MRSEQKKRHWIPAFAGMPLRAKALDPGLRRDDGLAAAKKRAGFQLSLE
jgi:hypothetical protein